MDFAIFNKMIMIIYFVISINCTKKSMVRKLVYQKDLSEHCRRRVVPSVFLGRKVHNANSKMLHFSRLDLPYNCFISVRTELGSNIILVIQVMSEKDLEKSCSTHANQLEVFELSEIYGGYWGPLPDSVLRQRPRTDNEPYILKSTEPTTRETIVTEESKIQRLTKSIKKTSTRAPTDEADEFINIEIPLVNVSAKLVPGEVQPTKAFDIDEMFDVIYDVTPKANDVNYETSIIPLLQFSLADQRPTLNPFKSEKKYVLDYNIPEFTPDPRIPIIHRQKVKSVIKGKPFPKINKNRNTILKFRKNNSTQSIEPKNIYFTKEYYNRKSSSRSIYSERHRINVKDHSVNYYRQKSLRRNTNVENSSVIYSFNKEKSIVPPAINRSKPNFSLMDILTKRKHNFSVYLSPDLSIYTKNFKIKIPLLNDSLTTKISFFTTTPLSHDYEHHESLPDNSSENNSKRMLLKSNAADKNVTDSKNVVTDSKNINSTSSTSDLSEDGNSNISEKTLDVVKSETANSSKRNYVTENITTLIGKKATTSNRPLHTSLKSGSTVDHESWENVIQAVPVIAVALNQTDDTKKVNPESANKKISKRSKRKSRSKRYLHVIPIEAARPHTLSTVKNTETTASIVAYFSDVQQFAQLIEVQDDEIQSRAALRYFEQYVGRSLFNVCDLEHAKTRHVLLFNSSRIVIAIRNFSLERMSLVLTTARTLTDSSSRCPPKNLECQVLGTRVCIDSVSTCDGVPNCGAFDIYDEDRLQCGEAVGLQHNVCLAAFTFLAVLLTMLYIVNYWLKRCVPKVSKAFFIYTDGIENILYLNTVMQSPTDDDNDSKHVFHNGFDEDIYMYTSDHNEKKGIRRILENISQLLSFTKSKQEIKPAEQDEHQLRPMYSFTQTEISKMIGKNKVDESVQTGDSLEMKILEKNIKSPKASSSKKNRSTVYSSEKIEIDFDNNLRKDSIIQMTSIPQKPTDVLKISPVRVKPSFDRQSGSAHSKSRRLSYYQPYFKSVPEEKELRTTELNKFVDTNISENRSHILNLTSEVYSEKSEASSHTRKRLRFDEHAHTIPDSEQSSEILPRPSVALSPLRGTHSKFNIKNSGADIDNEHQSSHASGSGRDFKRFWSGKKSKKKNQK